MQARFKDGSVMVCGGCSKDAELEYVGADAKRVCKVGLAAGKRYDGSTIWVNVVAWHGIASVLSAARKGDPVLVIGKLKTRDYNEKTYTDLVADFVSVCSASAAAYCPPSGDFQTTGGTAASAFTLSDDDEELPF